MDKGEAILVLLDRTVKYFITAGLVVGVGFSLLFLIAYITHVVERKKGD